MKLSESKNVMSLFLLVTVLLTCVVNVSAFDFPPLPPLQPGQAPEPVPGKDYVADELFVKFKEAVEEDKKAKIHEKLSSKKIKDFKFIKVDYVKLKKNMTVDEAIQRYMSDPDVEYAEPNVIYQFSSPPSDNPLYLSQWNIANINAPAAWNITTGRSDVVIGLIDSGINYLHEDFVYHDSILNTDVYNIWINPNEVEDGIDNDQNGYVDDIIGINTEQSTTVLQDPMDTYGHGTHVAGIIGSTPYNAKGIVGLNWDVKLLPCRFMYSTNGEVLTCIDYFIWERAHGTKIVAINMSWGNINLKNYCWGIQTFYNTIASVKDILFIAAAGNASLTNPYRNKDISDNDAQPFYPASYSKHFIDTCSTSPIERALLPNVISVAASDPGDQRGSWIYYSYPMESAYGRRSVHIGAPGIDIWSTGGYCGAMSNNLYCQLSGTSMAAPHVTSLAALVASKYLNGGQSYNTMNIRNLILTGGDDIDGLKNITITGKRINAYNSLNCSNRNVFSVLRISPPNNAASIYPLAPNTQTKLSAISLNCANSAGPVTVSPSGGTPFNLNEQTTVINGSDVGTGIYTGSWTPGTTLPNQITFSSPAGSETFYAPTVSSVSPSTGSQYAGTPQVFSTVYSDSNEAEDIFAVYIALRSDLTALDNAIAIGYDRINNNLYILNDDATAWLGPCTPGTSSTLSNSQGTLNCAQTTVSLSGNNLTINWNITPTGSFAGTLNIYLLAVDALGLDSGIIQKGPWTIMNPTLNINKSGNGAGTVTSTDALINCGITCSRTYNYGTSVTLTATASSGSTFAGWSGGGCSGTSATCTVTMDASKSVTVTFTQQTSNSFVSGSTTPSQVNAGGTYTIGCNYGQMLDCIDAVPGQPGSWCMYTGFTGTTAQFSCTAGSQTGTFSNTCRLFSGTPNNCAAQSGDPAGSVTVGSTTPQTYTIQTSAGTGGSIAPSGPVTVNSGSTSVFTITANSGYTISSVTGCGGTLNGTTYTTGQITGNCTVTATFNSFVSGSTTPSQVNAGGTYTISCNYGQMLDCIDAVPGQPGSWCMYIGFTGTTAQFSCTAGSQTGTFSNTCRLFSGTPNNCTAQSGDAAGSVTVW